MFPKDNEDTRIAVNKAVSSITYGLNQMMEVANKSSNPDLKVNARLLYERTFEALRSIGELLNMQGWKPPKDTL